MAKQKETKALQANLQGVLNTGDTANTEDRRPAKLTYSVKEMATALGVGMNVAYDLANREDFPSIRLGGRNGRGARIRIPVQGLHEWLERQTGGDVN